MKRGTKDVKLEILISGEELAELKRFSWQMVEAFGLDIRIEKYQGKRPIGLYSWDVDCILTVVEDALNDSIEYPNQEERGYKAIKHLFERLRIESSKFK